LRTVLLLCFILVCADACANGYKSTNPDYRARLISLKGLQEICDSSLYFINTLSKSSGFEAAYEFIEYAINYEKIQVNKACLIKHLYLKTKLLLGEKKFDECDTLLRYAIELSKEHQPEQTIHFYRTLVRIKYNKREYDSTYYYFNQAIEFHRPYDPYHSWHLYYSMFESYLELKDLENANYMLEKAYEITKTRMIRMDHGLILYWKRKLATEREDVKQMAAYTKEFYELTKNKDPEKLIAHGYDLGGGKSTSEKIQLYENLLRETYKLDFPHSVPIIRGLLAELYADIGNYSKALKHLNEVDTTDFTNARKKDHFQQSFDYASLLGDYQTATKSANELLKLINQINAEAKLRTVLEMQALYESERKEKEIQILDQENYLKDLTIQKERRNKIFLIMGLVLLSLVVFIVYKMQLLKSKANARLREQNEWISKAVEEKTVLLGEIHHRVKNNLQIISSLFKLQSRYIDDPLALEAITDGRNRIQSMALLHQFLYEGNEYDKVDIQLYCTQLITNIFETYSGNKNKIEYSFDVEKFKLDVDMITPIGLIINELVSNSLKHAFIGRNDGHILIELKSNADNQLKLSVRDDGIGYDPDITNKGRSFGMKLIESLCEKLEAKKRIIIDSGVCTEISIPLEKY
jgi:two-component sensor histidine kinase